MLLWIIPYSFLLLGLYWMYSERDLFRDGLRSYRWRRTKGQIIDSEDCSFLVPGVVGIAGTGIGLVEYSEPTYLYLYQVGQTDYLGDTCCFGVHIDKVKARYMIGDDVSVYYDPNEPRRSVLRRGLQPGTMLSTVPVVVGATALISILFG